jgi:tight adherence protein B
MWKYSAKGKMMKFILFGAILFIMSVVIIELIIYAFKNMGGTKNKRINKKLRKYTFVEGAESDADIMRKRLLSEIPLLNKILLHTPGIEKLDQLVIKANPSYPLGVYFLLSLCLGSMGFSFGIIATDNNLLATILGFVLMMVPFLYLLNLRQKRLEKFRHQLPEGLDLIARALKAGHAFSGSLALAAEQFDDPLGPELEETLGEINFGVSVQNALMNFAKRIECPEVRYFVVAVNLQRETGGNLAELMESLSKLIRENFRFQGRVRTLSAEGKISAIILILLPFLILGWINFTTPKFLVPLLTEPIGKIMLTCAAIMMGIGIISIRKIIKIEV